MSLRARYNEAPRPLSSRAGGRTGTLSSERDSKSIIRQWDREIETELRREAAASAGARGPWKAVVWGALWCLWLTVLFGAVALIRPLH